MNLLSRNLLFKVIIVFMMTGVLLAQAPVENSDKGAIILVSTAGQVQIKYNETDFTLPGDEVKPGKTITEGYTILTGRESEAVLLLSNGSLTTLGSNGELSIAQFSQKEFKGSGKKLSELETEPSTSKTKLKLAYGDLVFNVKKLNADSTFEIESPIGLAGIRGTVGEKSIQFNPVSGEITGTIKMISGWLGFTDKNGNQMDVSAGQSTTTQTTSSGQQIGNTQQGAVSQNDASSIAQTSGNSESKTANVSLNSVSNAKNDANSQGSGSSTGNGNNQGASLDSSSGNTKLKNDEVIREMGETVFSGASGTAEGAIFVSAVSGYTLANLKEIAKGLITGATTSASQWLDNQTTSLNNFNFALNQAIRSSATLPELAEVVAQHSDILNVNGEGITNLTSLYETGEITHAQLWLGMMDNFQEGGPLASPMRGILNHAGQPNPNKGAMVSFFNQIKNNSKTITPDKETIIAFAIQGTLEGIRTGAERANLDAQDIEGILDALDIAITPELVQQVPEVQQLNLPNLRAGEEIPILSDPNQEFALSLSDIQERSALASSSINRADPIQMVPFLIDTDGDGLFDAREKEIGSDINNPDTDGDLLKDGAEYIVFGTDPNNPDTDGDLVSDSVEVGLGEDPTVANGYGPDTDNDGLPDAQEAIIGTRIDHPDTDSDGWWDSFEIGVGNGLLESQANNPLVRNTTILGTSFTVSPVGGTDATQTWRINRITFD